MSRVSFATPTFDDGSSPTVSPSIATTRTPIGKPKDHLRVDFLASLISHKKENTEAVAVALDKFFEKMDLGSLENVGALQPKDIQTFAKTEDGKVFRIPLNEKRFLTIREYVRCGYDLEDLPADTTLAFIFQKIQAAKAGRLEPEEKSAGTTKLDLSKVPSLPKFSGTDEDFYRFVDEARRELGSYGSLDKYLDDPTLTEKNPDIGRSIFWSIVKALEGGHASELGRELSSEEGMQDPAMLWSRLKAQYDTDTNRSNIVITEFRRLFDLRLDAEISALEYGNKVKGCVRRLTTRNVVTNFDVFLNDILRAVILHGVEEEAYEQVRADIVRLPDRNYVEILKDLRDAEARKKIKDGTLPIGGDGAGIVRRTTTPKGSKGSKTKQRQTSTGAGTSRNLRLPDGLSKCIPHGLFKVLVDWVNDYNKGMSPSDLQKNYKLSAEKYTPSQPGSGKRNRQNQGTGGTNSDDTPSPSTTSVAPTSVAGNTPHPRKRIKLRGRGVVSDVLAVESDLRTGRRVHRLGDGLHAADDLQHIMISDSACDQTLCGPVFRMLKHSGRYISMTGAFAGRNVGQRFPVGQLAAKLVLGDGTEYCAIANEALHDTNPSQVESLLSVHQSLVSPENRIDDRSTSEKDIYGNPCTQKSIFGDIEVPFYFDGAKCFWALEKITDDELERLPRVVLTPDEPFEPDYRKYTRRSSSVSDRSLDEWQENLGYVPRHVVEKTLQATTQLVQDVPDAENREIPRDHFKSRFPQLKYRRVRDKCYSDTFFSSITSIRGYTCFQLFSYEHSGYDVAYPMRRRSQAASTLQDLLRTEGIPAVMHTDNAKEFKGKQWIKILRSYGVKSQFSEAHHQNQNLAERRGGSLKAAVTHLLFMSGAPLTFWCFALEYMVGLRNCLARRSLQWNTPGMMHTGDTDDISRYRIPFYKPVWYYAPKNPFPRPKMLPGRMLGIAEDVGDAFTYIILTEPDDGTKPQVIARSVVRRRYPRPGHVPEDETFGDHDEAGTLKFTTSDGRELYEPADDDAIEPHSDRSGSMLPSQVLERLPSDDVCDLLREAIEFAESPRPKKRVRFADSVPNVDDEVPSPGAGTIAMESLSPNPLAHSVQAQASTPLTETGVASAPLADSVDNVFRFRANDAEQTSSAEKFVLEESCASIGSAEHGGADLSFDGCEVQNDVARHLETSVPDAVDEDMFDSIAGHSWVNGALRFQVAWKTDEVTDVSFEHLRRDYPFETSKYLLENKIGSADGRYHSNHYQRWARHFQRECSRALRRVIRTDSHCSLDDFNRPPNLPDYVARRATHGGRVRATKRKKPGRNSRQIAVKYGVPVPRNVKEALEFDYSNQNTLWRDAIKKEMSALLNLGCFDFREPGYKPSRDYKFVPLHMVFDVKQDLTRKARLVCGGHVLDPTGVNSRSTVVKGISVRLLDLIAHRDGLKTLCGDIGNAFITAEPLEKVYSYAGPEFGDREGSLVLIMKALYGLRSSSRAFRCHFAEFLRSLGFSGTRYDRDVWMRLREEGDGYDYVCTHVDDFRIHAKDPGRWMEQIKSIFVVKSEGGPSYYLGNDYRFCEEFNGYLLSCHTYCQEAVRRVEDLFGSLVEHGTPMPAGEHPEMDTSPLLDDTGIRQYPMLIGMAQWACTIGRFDIAFAVSSLSRFSANPRRTHLELALYIFGYLKRFPRRAIGLTSEPFEWDVLEADNPLSNASDDWSEEYPDAKEEIDLSLPEAFGQPLETTVFSDADFAHDCITRRSITGIIVFVGSTPVHWISKRQGCIATSTYGSELVALRTAVEEAMALRYMLRCLGIPVTDATTIVGDNLGSLQSTSNPDGELKKKHLGIAYHFVREAVAAKIIRLVWCESHENFADVCTKSLGKAPYSDLINAVMWS